LTIFPSGKQLVNGEFPERRIQKLCEEKRIIGAVRFGHAWAITERCGKVYRCKKKKGNIRNKMLRRLYDE
jgi:hypothetical protein